MKKITLLLFVLLTSHFVFAQFAKIDFEIELRNERNYDLPMRFSKGEIWETENPNSQNLVLMNDTVIILKPFETRKVTLSGYCINQHRDLPTGNVIPIPIAVNRNKLNQIKSPDDIWNKISW